MGHQRRLLHSEIAAGVAARFPCESLAGVDMRRLRAWSVVLLCASGLWAQGSPTESSAVRSSGFKLMETLAVDAGDAPRKFFHARITIPATPGDFVLLYPKWIPGEHGPSGPVVDTAGIYFRVHEGAARGTALHPSTPTAGPHPSKPNTGSLGTPEPQGCAGCIESNQGSKNQGSKNQGSKNQAVLSGRCAQAPGTNES